MKCLVKLLCPFCILLEKKYDNVHHNIVELSIAGLQFVHSSEKLIAALNNRSYQHFFGGTLTEYVCMKIQNPRITMTAQYTKSHLTSLDFDVKHLFYYYYALTLIPFKSIHKLLNKRIFVTDHHRHINTQSYN